MTQGLASRLRKALLDEGVEAAIRIRDARRAELEQKRARLQRELDSTNADLAQLHKEFAEAVRDALAKAGTTGPGDRGMIPGRTYEQWVLDTIAERGGAMFGPVLYDLWQDRTGDHSRKNRLKIQSVVSQLISKNKLRKLRPAEMPEVATGGRRGSVLVVAKGD